MKQISKRHLLTVLIIFSIYFVLVHILGRTDDYGDNCHKKDLIEESIKSNENQRECQIPDLPVHSPEMLAFLKDEPPIECGNEDYDWMTCEKSLCFLKPSVQKRTGKIICDFTEVLRKNDYKIKLKDPVTTDGRYTLKDSDIAKVKCRTQDRRERWHGTVLGIRENIDRELPKENQQHSQLNVLMYGFDSLSRNAFIRKLPNSYDYLMNTLKGDVLEGYNIVGDGTPQALIPLLTGLTELELPETRKRKRGSQYVNVYPMIWKDYERNGYVTAFNEDVPDIGTFSYRLNGFDEQPTDHYMRTYYLTIQNDLSSYRKFCVGHKPSHKTMLDYTKEFMLKYLNIPRFVFSFHGELSHDSINLIGVADNDITDWLISLHTQGILNNTILIIMSDHGNRFASVRNTLQGKQEERLPFFCFVFPQWFKDHFKKEYEHFKKNTQRLTTPFDVHATLKDILKIQSDGIQDTNVNVPSSRAISLFNTIPRNRSCADAYIEPHWCACLNWKEITDTSTEAVVRAAITVIDAINKYTHEHRDLCEILTLQDINWAAKLLPHDNLIRFKQNKDFDGFVADLTSSTKIILELYQVKLITSPGYSIFEASVTHDLETNSFNVKLSDISRVNKYGDQAKCILDSLPELRKYCYCKKQ